MSRALNLRVMKIRSYIAFYFFTAFSVLMPQMMSEFVQCAVNNGNVFHYFYEIESDVDFRGII